MYLVLGGEAGTRQATYRELFRYELDPSVADTVQQATLGDARFAEQVAAMLGRRVIPSKAGRPRKVVAQGGSVLWE